MDNFSKRAGIAAGVIVGGVLAFFLVKFILFAEGFLAALLIAVGVVAAGSACAVMIAWARRSWRSPHIVFDTDKKQASVVIEQDGAWTAIPKQPFPSLTSFTYHQNNKPVPALPEPVVEAAAPVSGPPSARALISQGAVGRGEEILLGFDGTGQEIRRTWKQMKAVLILGLQGGGKTTTACWMLLQVVLAGGRIALIDKHAQSEEDSMAAKLAPLKGFFACPIGGDPAAALDVIAYVREVFDDRLNGAPLDFGLILVVDEFSAIARQAGTDGPWVEVAAALLPLLEDLNMEGRKHKVYALCIGQVANASRTGGSEVRDTFNTRIVHAMREKQATLLSLTDFKQEIARLEVGQVYVDMEGAREPFFARIPYVSEADLSFVAGRFVAPPVLPPLPWKPGRGPSEKDSAALSPSLPPQEAPQKLVKVPTEEEREREKIIAAHLDHPDYTASDLRDVLRLSNNKIAKIRRIITEYDAGQDGAKAQDA
jgi:hypothetical protein